MPGGISGIRKAGNQIRDKHDYAESQHFLRFVLHKGGQQGNSEYKDGVIEKTHSGKKKPPPAKPAQNPRNEQSEAFCRERYKAYNAERYDVNIVGNQESRIKGSPGQVVDTGHQYARGQHSGAPFGVPVFKVEYPKKSGMGQGQAQPSHMPFLRTLSILHCLSCLMLTRPHAFVNSF